MMPRFTPRRVAFLILTVMILGALLLILSWCSRGDALKLAKDNAQTANATGKALDTVARETPVIRQEQEEKQRAVDEIEGSDTRLPDGYGAELERVRDGKRRNP